MGHRPHVAPPRARAVTTTPPEAKRADAPPMTPERWRRIEDVLGAALATDRMRRDAVVADACGGDDTLRREVESLLAAHDRASGDDFLGRPAAEALAVS